MTGGVVVGTTVYEGFTRIFVEDEGTGARCLVYVYGEHALLWPRDKVVWEGDTLTWIPRGCRRNVTLHKAGSSFRYEEPGDVTPWSGGAL